MVIPHMPTTDPQLNPQLNPQNPQTNPNPNPNPNPNANLTPTPATTSPQVASNSAVASNYVPPTQIPPTQIPNPQPSPMQATQPAVVSPNMLSPANQYPVPPPIPITQPSSQPINQNGTIPAQYPWANGQIPSSIPSSIPPTNPIATINIPTTTPQSTPLQGSSPQNMPPQGVSTPPRAPVIMNKQGSQIWFGSLLIGCGMIFILIFGLGGFVLYYLVSNPDQLNGIMDIVTAKTLLTLFTSVFFGILFFAGFGMLILNGYRLSTVKEWSKIWYVFWLIIGIFVLGTAIAWWTMAISTIQQIDTNAWANSSALVIPSLINGSRKTPVTPNTLLIAPVGISYEINPSMLQTALWAQIPLASVQSLSLDCGNEQILWPSSSTAIPGYCLYADKGTYQLSLNITYTDPVSRQQKTQSYPAGSIPVVSVVSVSTTSEKPAMNDAKTEIIISRPMRVTFDAQKVVTDLWLTDNIISRDLDGDGTQDAQNNLRPSFQYNESKLYTVTYTLWNSRQIFSFPLRINQSDIPTCSITGSLGDDNEYNFTAILNGASIVAKDYRRDVIDADTNSIIESIKKRTGNLTYQFKPGSYIVKNTFLNEDNKEGFCESEVITVWSSAIDAQTQISYKTPKMNEYKNISNTWDTILSGGNIVVSSLPVYIKLQLTKIIPSNQDVSIKVLYNTKPILETREWLYEFTIEDPKNQSVQLILRDKITGKESIKTINIINQQAKVLGKLIVTPNSAGTDPFEVSLDASTTTLTDKTDEIVTFTRDFGDGEISKNINQGKVTHIYRFDPANESWEYNPTVTIKTKKGISQTIWLDVPIIVKRATRTISIKTDSHPGQVASIGERIQLRLEANGLINGISRDFGDGRDPLECAGRECIDSTVIFEKSWDYTIRGTIKYEDHPPVTTSLKMKIE